jgi:hypothetical protein
MRRWYDRSPDWLKMKGQKNGDDMKTWTHFAPRIDMLNAAGEVQVHLAGVEDYMRCAGGSGDFLPRGARRIAVDVDASLRPPRGSHAHARLCRDARDRDIPMSFV